MSDIMLFRTASLRLVRKRAVQKTKRQS